MTHHALSHALHTHHTHDCDLLHMPSDQHGAQKKIATRMFPLRTVFVPDWRAWQNKYSSRGNRRRLFPAQKVAEQNPFPKPRCECNPRRRARTHNDDDARRLISLNFRSHTLPSPLSAPRKTSRDLRVYKHMCIDRQLVLPNMCINTGTACAAFTHMYAHKSSFRCPTHVYAHRSSLRCLHTCVPYTQYAHKSNLRCPHTHVYAHGSNLRCPTHVYKHWSSLRCLHTRVCTQVQLALPNTSVFTQEQLVQSPHMCTHTEAASATQHMCFGHRSSLRCSTLVYAHTGSLRCPQTCV